jgi:dTDP-4-amino-4,6-dideoxygalactose transaminase
MDGIHRSPAPDGQDNILSLPVAYLTKKRMIQVTKPFLPPIEEYEEYMRQIWDRNWLTNNGPLLIELEDRLKEYLGVKYLSVMSNGTVTLQAALKTLKKKGKIITTPFSYIATTSVILWEDFIPVFVDIDPLTFNADPLKGEGQIDDQTVAILITHCFGVPCDVQKWNEISIRYQIPVIYDAAHAFGVKVNGESILNFGYASSLSFHATKLYHMIEGGALVMGDAEHLREINLRRNFGHDGPDRFSEVGINGKNSEFHAAMGLVNLTHIDQILASRRIQYFRYVENLHSVKDKLQFQKVDDSVTYNYSYFPVLFESESVLLKIFNVLNANDIYPRRYFYPALNSLSFTSKYGAETPVAKNIASSVLCLPLFHEMTSTQQDFICDIIIRALSDE